MTSAIENQVERFAPGFRERVLARHVMNTSQLESYNANYIGGDINGGIIDIGQLFTRPALAIFSLPYFCKRHLSLFFVYTSGWGCAWNVRVPCRKEGAEGYFWISI
jgi:hypothetical protein